MDSVLTKLFDVSKGSIGGNGMRIPFIRTVLLGIALTAFPTFASAADAPRKEQVDLLLVLAADVSESVNETKFRLQRDGYAAALVDPRVLRAARSGPYRRIAVAYVEWAGLTQQKTVIDWTIIDGLDAARRFSMKLLKEPRPFQGYTAIGDAVEFSLRLMMSSPYEAERKTIDISGDGTNNKGSEVNTARDVAVLAGVVVNGLVILSAVPHPAYPEHTHPKGGLEEYYRRNVIGGPGSFVGAADDYKSFGTAILRKMIAEIAMR